MSAASGTLNQQSTTQTSGDGSQVFRVYSLFLNPVTITDDGVFLYQINDETDAALDTFTRVATVADMGDYERARADAVTAGEEYYRSAALTRDYDDLDTAVLAKTAIQEQVSALLNSWTTADTSFFGTAAIAVPLTTTPTLQGLVDLAEAAHVTYVAAVSAEADALTAKNNAIAAQTTLQGIHDVLEPQVEALVAANTGLQVAATLDALAYTYAIASSLNTDIAHTTFWTAYLSVNGGLEVYAPPINSTTSSLSALEASVQSSLGTAGTTVSTATSAHLTAQADTTAKLALRDDYMADVRAIDATYVFSWE